MDKDHGGARKKNKKKTKHKADKTGQNSVSRGPVTSNSAARAGGVSTSRSATNQRSPTAENSVKVKDSKSASSVTEKVKDLTVAEKKFSPDKADSKRFSWQSASGDVTTQRGSGDSQVFDLTKEFPSLGIQASDIDAIAMQGRDNSGNLRQPYAYPPPLGVAGANMVPPPLMTGTPFYNQFYSNTNSTHRGNQPYQHQHQYGGHSYQSRNNHQQQVRESRSLGSLPAGGRDVASKASREQISLVAKEAISRLADVKEYVSIERVEKLILQHYNVIRLSQLNVRNVEHIEAIRELQRVHGKVNAYISAFMRTRSASTLHELQRDLENFCCKPGEEFESLQIGPLQCLPLVYEHFKFPSKNDIPHITTCDVLDMLRDWLSKNNLWTSRDLDLQKFMEYMQVRTVAYQLIIAN